MTDEHETEYDLVMPFVCVKSKGGPYEDGAFAAGYQAGLLDAAASRGDELIIPFITYSHMVVQFDLIAMRNGYRLNITSDDGEWVNGELVKA